VKVYNDYILTVAILLLTTTVTLVALGISNLRVFWVVYTLECLLVTEIFISLNKKALSQLRMVMVVLFFVFLILIGFEVVRILE